jgi:hypothetical protein
MSWQTCILAGGRLKLPACLVKRLLNLAYIWTGSINGVKLLSLGNRAVLCRVA